MAGAIRFIVYNPPSANLPFLAVTLYPDGEAQAHPFNSAAEAEAFNQEAYKAFNENPPPDDDDMEGRLKGFGVPPQG